MRYMCDAVHGYERPDQQMVREIGFVAYQEPIRELRLSFLWESLAEEMISDSPFHSDLDPLTAPVWLMDLRPEEQTNASVSNYLTSLRHIRDRYDSDGQPLLSRSDSVSQSESEVRNVFDRLSGQVPMNLSLPTFRSYLPRLSESVAEYLVDEIFRNSEAIVAESGESFGLESKSLGSCAYDNVTWRISHVVAFLVVWLKDSDSLCLIWRLILHRLRKSWESNQPLIR